MRTAAVSDTPPTMYTSKAWELVHGLHCNQHASGSPVAPVAPSLSRDMQHGCTSTSSSTADSQTF